MRLLQILAALLLTAACTPGATQKERVTDYIDPHIGSGGHGHVFVGTSVPFGMVQLGSTSVSQVWDLCSGYHTDENTIIGFSHTHLSGTGIGDLFDITIMPVTGEVTYARGNVETPESGLWSPADRSKEVATPGYYAVPLTRYGITAELTATARVGLHRYTFPQADDAAIIIDLENGGCWDRTTEAYTAAEGNNRIVGYRYSRGWAARQKIYFVAEFQKPFESVEKVKGELYTRASFCTHEGEEILVKVAISPVSIEGAKEAMAQELPHWNFEEVKTDAEELWEKELSRIKIKSDNDTLKRIFYTAMYHTMMAPVLFSDVNGDYRGADGEVYNSATPRYTCFSLWDTYRAKQPLMTIIEPQKAADFAASMIDICNKQGNLPVWHLWGNETNCMVGDPGIPVVADAIVKKIPGIDKEAAFAAIKKSADKLERGKALRNEHSYIPCNLKTESVAYELEYALADAAAAQAAQAIGDKENFEHFTHKSHSYRQLYDKNSGFIRGKDSEGVFREPFNPYYSVHRADDYCEGNAWQYTWLVPHDVAGLANLMGGRSVAVAQLDKLFDAPSTIEGDPSPDISGMIGQYAHGNEPSHHIIYLYTMLGEPHKCARLVREVLRTQYSDKPDGLSGNEDMGQMSAWYIMSALGFYEVEPASARYWLGSPIVDEATLAVQRGTFTIKCLNNSEKNIYIKSVTLNGKEHALPYIEHKDIAAGGSLIIEMCDTPALWYDADILFR